MRAQPLHARADLRGGKWHLSGPADFLRRVKRIFERAAIDGTTVVLQHNALVCRDLVWMRTRHPFEVSHENVLAAWAEKHEQDEKVTLELVDGNREPLEFDLALPPRDYQRVAAELAIRTGGVLCADDLGLGKTISGLCTLAPLEHRPALVVTMTHLPRQWEREVRRFLPTASVHIASAGAPYAKLGGTQPYELPDILIISYSKLQGWADTLRGRIRAVVFDEIQELRHATTRKYQGAKLIREGAACCMGLSATPVYNYGGEIYNILDVVRPGALGTHEEFLREWCSDLPGHAKLKDPAAFGDFSRKEGLLIRRTRADVKREVPPISIVPYEIDHNDAEWRRLSKDLVAMAETVCGSGLSFHESGQATRQFDLKLRQYTGIAKAPHVAELVKLIVESGEQVVLWGWHRLCYEIWLEVLKDHKPVLFTGSETERQKQLAVDAFLSGEARVLIMSLRSGAGLDGLQHVCSVGVFGELDWSPKVHDQAGGRLARDGQLKPVTLYFPLSRVGSDPPMQVILDIKESQSQGIIDPDAPLSQATETPKIDIMRTIARQILSPKETP